MRSQLHWPAKTLDFKIKLLLILSLCGIAAILKANEVTYSEYSAKDFFYERLSIS